MNEIMSSVETEAIVLVDSTNAFKTINRQVALYNIGVTCPAISTVLNNAYQTPVKLFVTGGVVVESSEGITIGPLMGYHPNGSKTHLIVKPELQEHANHIFECTGNVTPNLHMPHSFIVLWGNGDT